MEGLLGPKLTWVAKWLGFLASHLCLAPHCLPCADGTFHTQLFCERSFKTL